MAATTAGGGASNVMSKALRLYARLSVPKPQQHPTPVGNNYPNIQPLTGGSPTTPTSPLTGNPSAIDELELMHQFSTATYQSLCVSESETHTWQVLIPRLALKHRFLMNSILALASLHLATKYEGPEALAYIDAGLEHHSLSLEPFRITIDNITPDNCDAAFAQAVVTTAISLALPQLTAARGNAFRMIDNILMVFELLQGVKKILTIAKPWIKLELFSQGKFWKNELGDLRQRHRDRIAPADTYQ
ncbi:hypothetical protein N7470_001510 [Penicillium chermesinum]|nr:hypothetical protein N7470_001510 [Penicillium chermesinum]